MSALPTAVPMVLADSSAACSPRLGFPPVPAQAMSICESRHACLFVTCQLSL